MPPRKSLDIDPEISVLLAKAEKLKTDHKLMLGELVIETGIHKLLNADQLRDELVRLRDQAQAQAKQATPKDGRADAGRFPARPEAATPKPHGLAAPEPARHRAADLLAGATPGRAGPRPAAEGPGLERAS